MNRILLSLLIIFSAASLIFINSESLAYAQTFHTIIMPSGSSDPDAPFFWSEKTTGVTTGEITVHPDDSVTWENADTALHTITSVTQSGEIDGVFDSGLIESGDSYSLTFSELGDFYYFCSIHPWMNGVVHVIKDPGSVQSIKNVGSGYTEDGLGFEVKYVLDTNLQNVVHIDPSEKTVTFLISGDTQNEQISLVLPTELIENPTAVWVDGTMVEFETDSTMTGTKLLIPIEPLSKEIKIMGTHVIPEFGFIAVSILGLGLISILIFTRFKLSIMSFR